MLLLGEAMPPVDRTGLKQTKIKKCFLCRFPSGVLRIAAIKRVVLQKQNK
jgi:hypothetical protein